MCYKQSINFLIDLGLMHTDCMRPRSIKELMGEEAGNAGWRETVTRGRL